MPAIFVRQGSNASVIAFPTHLRVCDSALVEAVKSHRLPHALESALLREAALFGQGAAALEQAIALRLRAEPIDLRMARTIMLVGPSGSGKSAVAAKIIRQAQSLGRDAEFVAAAKGVAGGSHGKLIIADCAGFNPRNAKACAAFAALGDLEQTIGVVSALGDAEEISEIIAAANMRRVIVTGLDMARRAGALAAAALQGAKLAHVTRDAACEKGLEKLNASALAALLAKSANAH